MTQRNEGWIVLIAQALLLWLAVGAAGQGLPVDSSPPGPAPGPVRNGVVLSGAAGIGSRDFSGQISLWGHVGAHAVGLRTAGTSDLNFVAPSTSESDWAVLYGRRMGSGRTWGRLAAGAGLVESVRPGQARECWLFFCNYDRIVEQAVGVAFQADGVWGFSRPAGLGISVFGNLNSVGSFVGAALALHVGVVR